MHGPFGRVVLDDVVSVVRVRDVAVVVVAVVVVGDKVVANVRLVVVVVDVVLVGVNVVDVVRLAVVVVTVVVVVSGAAPNEYQVATVMPNDTAMCNTQKHDSIPNQLRCAGG